MRRRRILVIGVAGAGLLVLGITLAGAQLSPSPSQAVQMGPGAVPPDVVDAALSVAQDRYGPVSQMYQEAATTLGFWASVEPGNTSSLDVMLPDQPVYAVFVQGDFAVEANGAQTRYPAGRIVMDKDGRLLLLSLWPVVKPADPPFGPEFDDG